MMMMLAVVVINVDVMMMMYLASAWPRACVNVRITDLAHTRICVDFW